MKSPRPPQLKYSNDLLSHIAARHSPLIMAPKGERAWTWRNFAICYLISLAMLAMGYPSAIISTTLAQPSFLMYMGLLDLQKNPPTLTKGKPVARRYSTQANPMASEYRGGRLDRSDVRSKSESTCDERFSYYGIVQTSIPSITYQI